MEEFRRLKFAFNYCNKSRKIYEPEQLYWAVQCFKKLNKITYNDQKVKDFLKEFSVKALHLGMIYCRRVEHEFTCNCEHCFLFDNAKILLLKYSSLAHCFVADVCDIQTDLSYRSTCRKTCPNSKSFTTIENIDKWSPDDSGFVLDYLKLYAVFNSIIH